MTRTMIFAFASACVVAVPSVTSAATFGTNLVTNGDAETGDMTGFTTTGNFTVEAYNQGGYPGTGDAGVAEGGKFMFSGGENDAFSTALQTIDISSLASFIDKGSSTFKLSALIGGYATQEDYATVQVSFLSSGGALLGSGTIGPVSAEDRGGVSGLLPESTNGFVPVGARSVNLLLSATRLTGFSDDGYIDNISLALTKGAAVSAVPEPASWAMMIGGIGFLGGAMRRQRSTRPSVSFA